MGKVLTVLRVSPVEGVNASDLAKEIVKLEGCNSSKVEDFVFGVKVVRASFICEDSKPVDFEAQVSQIKEVDNVQVEECGLIG